MASTTQEQLSDLASKASAHVNNKEYEKAEPLYQRLIELRTKSEGSEATNGDKYNLAVCLVQQKKYAEAKPVLREVLQGLEARETGRDTPDFMEQEAATARNLAETLKALGKTEEGEKMQAKSEDMSAKATKNRGRDQAFV